MKKPLPHPYPLHIHFENLPPIDEERTSSEGSEKPRRVERKELPTRKLSHGEASPGTPRSTNGNETPENDVSLEEKCLIYEAVAASLRDEILSIQAKLSTSDKSLRNAMRYLIDEKEGLMKECNQLEEKISILTCELSN